MKIENDLENVVYFDFAEYKGSSLKSYLRKVRDYKDGTSMWEFHLGLPSLALNYKDSKNNVKAILYTKVISVRGTKEQALTEVYHYMGSYTDFEKWAYEFYKLNWCELRGYNVNDATINGFNGECFASINEYLSNEFIEERDNLTELFSSAKNIAEELVKEGCKETSQGNYIFYFDEINSKFKTNFPEDSYLIKAVRAFLEAIPEEVSDVIIDNDSIDVNFYTNYCQNIEV